MHPIVDHYLARAGMAFPGRQEGDLFMAPKTMDPGKLVLVVPGLEIVEIKEDGIQCRWSTESMWKRLQDLREEFGVADERLAYRCCGGEVIDRQPMLPHLVQVESRLDAGFGAFSAWTDWGLSVIEGGFIYRICEPHRGGPSAVPFGDERVRVGNRWWLVGTRGDSPEVLELEIEASPLNFAVKENLLQNLRNRN